jgi:hypothetical protein
MRLAGILTILTGVLLVAGHGHAAGVFSLVRHALRVFG